MEDENMLKMKITMTKEGTIFAMCDPELLGKIIKEGKTVIDLQKHATFYSGNDIDERSALVKRQLAVATKYAKSINVVGKKSVEFMKEMGFKTDGAKTIGGVPHLQIYKMD
jgi:hypothetical protein